MRSLWSERVKMAVLGWLATVLTSLSFLPALEDASYLVKGAVLTAAVIGIGIVLRALRVPALVVFAVELVAMAELLLLRFGDDLRWGLLPTRATLRGLDTIVRDGFDVAQKYQAPAPANTGLMLMVLFAICLVAIFVDAIAVGLGRVPLSGLPLLALYTIPVAALPKGVPFYAFVPGAAAYIAMLTADERDRLAHWGRLVSRNSATQEPSEIDTSGLHTTGRQVSVLALSIAVVIPIFIPALSASILDSGRGTGQGGNGSGKTLSFEDPMVSLANQLRRTNPIDLVQVDKSAVSPEYLRLVALDNPGPTTWTATPVDLANTIGLTNVLPAPTGLGTDVDTSLQSMRITLSNGFPQDSKWLPVPYDLTHVNTNAPFAYVPKDQTVTARSENAITQVGPYDLDYEEVRPTPEQLRAAGDSPAEIVASNGEVPPGVPAIVGETAASVTASATSPYDQAVLLQNYFRTSGDFSYSLDIGYGAGYEAMGQFLSRKVGFCQQYAATMAMMARTLDIPSRVIVGFLAPARADAGVYFITSDNVHAWPELYFEGVGWVRFEPTPGLNLGYPNYAQPTATTSTGPTGNTVDPDTANPTNSVPSDRATTDSTAAGGSGAGSGPPFLPSRNWLIALVLIALLFLPAGLRYAVRRARLTRPLDLSEAAESAWAELRDHVRDLRLPWSGSMTPRARERDVAQHVDEDPVGLEALHRLAMSVERARYSASPPTESAPAADARAVMTAISRGCDWPQRLRAFFWPTSLMPDIRRGWARTTQRLGRRPRLS